jgi:hypothetical protein
VGKVGERLGGGQKTFFNLPEFLLPGGDLLLDPLAFLHEGRSLAVGQLLLHRSGVLVSGCPQILDPPEKVIPAVVKIKNRLKVGGNVSVGDVRSDEIGIVPYVFEIKHGAILPEGAPAQQAFPALRLELS